MQSLQVKMLLSLWVFIFACTRRNVECAMNTLETCSDDQQRQILPTLLDCEARDEVVHLDLPNETFVHIVPNHVTVKRCGGSCSNRFHSCLPSNSATRSISVLLFPRPTSEGVTTPSVCAEALVEEHTACTSACRTRPQDCNEQQSFAAGECRCVCSNDADRAGCLASGRYWNPATCRCLCRNPMTFPQCPTGYRFDDATSCSCISHGEYASALLEILVLIVVSTLVISVYGVIQCFKHRLGFFQKEEERMSEQSVTELRTIFRQISQTPSSYVRYEPIGGESRIGSKSSRKSASAEAIFSTRLQPLVERRI